MPSNTAVSRSNLDSIQLDIAQYATVESFMHKVFRREACDGDNVPASKQKHSSTTLLDDTGTLVESASRAIGFLSARCESLTVELDQAQVVCAEHIKAIENWKALALELQDKVADVENEHRTLTARFQTAEARLVKLEQTHKETALRADSAEQVSERLQKQVEAAFGQGSHIRAAMDAANRQADAAEQI